MGYLKRNVPMRESPTKLFPGLRSIICVAMSYQRQEPTTSDAGSHGRVARYARGRDYHVVLRKRLEQLADRLRDTLKEPFESRAFVDTGPILERELAARAGLGWIGKNTLLMHPQLGSYLFLGELFTTLELEPDPPFSDHCGTCTRCLDACPTDAFPAPYELDASRCISYLTIERRDDIPEALHEAMGDWVFGCDICQEVCPHNRRAPLGSDPDLSADVTPGRVPLDQLVNLRSGDYRRLTRDSAARRATRAMWQRNARIVAANAARRSD